MSLPPSLQQFVALFVRWNERINVSAARTVDDVTLQVVDCMAILPYVAGPRAVDVGSGGGLPALVIAACRPDVQVVSIEPVHKKAAFQSRVVRELGLTNVAIEVRRVDPAADGFFDTAVSRATFDLLEWLEIGSRLVRAGGVVLGMEGKEQRDLPAGAERFPYDHGGKTRAVIRYQR